MRSKFTVESEEPTANNKAESIGVESEEPTTNNKDESVGVESEESMENSNQRGFYGVRIKEVLQ